MSLEPTGEEREQLEQITAAWEEYDRTYDPSTVADYLAEDVMLMIPEQSPIIGREAAVDYLDRPEEEASPEINQWAENLFVSGDLAVVHAGVATLSDETGEPIDEGIKGIDVYRRQPNEGWKLIITIYNSHV